MIDNVLARNTNKKTIFLAWMEANAKYQEARKLTFSQFPESFVYDSDMQEWHPRKRGFTVGRLSYFPPEYGELYYLRLLLNIQVGCTNYDDLRTLDGKLYDTFCDTCFTLGLLFDYREFVEGIKEASTFASGPYPQKLFVTLLLGNTMTKAYNGWQETWQILANGIVYVMRKQLKSPRKYMNAS